MTIEQLELISAFGGVASYIIETGTNFFDDDDLKDAIVWIGKDDVHLTDEDLDLIVSLMRETQAGFVKEFSA